MSSVKYEQERKEYDEATAAFHTARITRKQKKRKAHKAFVKHMRKYLRVMDLLVITMVLFNFGAVVITNALVVRENPEMKFLEANPTQSKLNNYEQHPKGNEFMKALFFQSLMWAGFLTLYIYARMHIVRYWDFWTLGFIVLFYFYLIYWDFFNDLGYFIGKIIWG